MDVFNQFLNRMAGSTKNCAREDVYTEKQLRLVLFKAAKEQSLSLTPSQFIQIW